MLLIQSLFSIVFCNLVVHYSNSYAQSLPNRSYSPESSLNTILDSNNDNSQEKKWIESQEATDKLYISSKIRYRYSITEVFSKTINRNGNESREVKFQMALPEAAFISKFIIEVDGVSYEALVKEKQVAKQEYESAKIKGQTAGLMEVKETNILEVSLTVEPNNTVNFNLTYEEFLLRKLGYYEHHIYINPSQLENSTDYRVKVDILESQNLTTIVIPDLQNSVNFKPQGELSKNASILRPTGNRAIIEWTPTFAERNKYIKEGMLGQFLVRYDIERESDVGEVLLMNGYFVHFFAPPNVLPLRKHVIFILDTSGSMWGRRIQQLKEVMGTVINDLKPDDYLNIIAFSETSTSWSPANEQPQIIPLPTTEINLRQAHIYIKTLQADKGTNIYSAIMDGLEVASVGKDKLPDNVESLILFVTDGEPTVGVKNCDKIRKDIKAKNNESVPIYSIALGTGADFTFLKELSLENNGFGRKIYESGDAAIQIRGFYKEISSPLLSNVTFKYTSQGDNKIQKTSKRNFLKAFSGGEIAVVGTFVEKRKDEIIANISFESNSTEEYPTSPPIFIVEINANGRDGHVMLKSSDVLYTIDDAYSFPSNISDASTNKTLPTAEPGHPEENNFLERLWAYLTVKQLLDIHPTVEHLHDYEYILESHEVLDADQPTLHPIPELPKSNKSSADRC